MQFLTVSYRTPIYSDSYFRSKQAKQETPEYTDMASYCTQTQNLPKVTGDFQ